MSRSDSNIGIQISIFRICLKRNYGRSYFLGIASPMYVAFCFTVAQKSCSVNTVLFGHFKNLFSTEVGQIPNIPFG